MDRAGRTFLNNHLRITVAINPQDQEEKTFHVVRILTLGLCIMLGVPLFGMPQGYSTSHCV